tara:strand:+ start:1071 stop:1418 length:348 start_codon:yes stop_codon:yes gene_type:complete
MDLLTQLAEAKASLESIWDSFDRYNGNNPKKYQSAISRATSAYYSLERRCKAEKLIPYTEDELVGQRLDAAFPNAKSKQIVELDGVKYKRTFSPNFSNSGKTIVSWDRDWILWSD